MLLSLLLLAELPVLFALLRRSGFSPFPHINLIYFIGAQVAVTLMAADLVAYKFLAAFSTGAYKTHYTGVMLSFAALFFAFALIFRVPRSQSQLAALNTLRGIQGVGLGGMAGALIAFHMALFYLFDWPKVWSNFDYLLMGQPEILTVPAASGLILSYKLIGLATVALAVFAQVRRRWGVFSLLAPFAAFDILYQLAAHSRSAALYLAMAGAAHYVLTRRTRPLVVSGLLAVLALMLSLGGRRYGSQGFASLILSGEVLMLYLRFEPFSIFINFFEGAFASAELFKRTFTANATYEALSFSPLFSFIDGYEAVRARYQYDFHQFFPPPAIFELWSFSWPFKLLYAATQIVAGLLTLRLSRGRPSLLALGLNILMAFAVYLQFAYTVRHVYRLFLLIIAVGLVANAAKSFNKQDQRQRRHYRPQSRQRHPDFRTA